MSPQDKVVVIGASAGGIEALTVIIAASPDDFSGAVLVVQHLSLTYVSNLPQVLGKHAKLKVVFAKNGEILQARKIYVARPDHHLLIENDRIVVSRGPKENRFRLSINALFRHGNIKPAAL